MEKDTAMSGTEELSLGLLSEMWQSNLVPVRVTGEGLVQQHEKQSSTYACSTWLECQCSVLQYKGLLMNGIQFSVQGQLISTDWYLPFTNRYASGLDQEATAHGLIVNVVADTSTWYHLLFGAPWTLMCVTGVNIKTGCVVFQYSVTHLYLHFSHLADALIQSK